MTAGCVLFVMDIMRSILSVSVNTKPVAFRIIEVEPGEANYAVD